MTSETVVT